MSTQHPLFPVNLVADWQIPSRYQLNVHLLNWLIDPSSLTARLKQQSLHFRVEVLGQRIESCHVEEASDDIQAGDQVLVREVLLYCDDKPHVFARSLLPLTSLTGEEQQLAHLGTQSLGQVIFNNPELQRKNIQVAPFEQNSSVACLSTHLKLPVYTPLWGRRSTFMLHDKPLMVAEVFLPDAHAYQQASVML